MYGAKKLGGFSMKEHFSGEDSVKILDVTKNKEVLEQSSTGYGLVSVSENSKDSKDLRKEDFS